MCRIQKGRSRRGIDFGRHQAVLFDTNCKKVKGHLNHSPVGIPDLVS
jgi:hypothetical protein